MFPPWSAVHFQQQPWSPRGSTKVYVFFSLDATWNGKWPECDDKRASSHKTMLKALTLSFACWSSAKLCRSCWINAYETNGIWQHQVCKRIAAQVCPKKTRTSSRLFILECPRLDQDPRSRQELNVDILSARLKLLSSKAIIIDTSCATEFQWRNRSEMSREWLLSMTWNLGGPFCQPNSMVFNCCKYWSRTFQQTNIHILLQCNEELMC